MSNVLVVSGHPRTGDDSVANKTILEELAVLLPGAEIDHLDDLYPEYTFDVEAEQEKLRAADVIVLQYPLWWYGWPALLQKGMGGGVIAGRVWRSIRSVTPSCWNGCSSGRRCRPRCSFVRHARSCQKLRLLMMPSVSS